MQVPPLRHRSDGSGRDDKIEGNRGFRGARGFGMGQRQERPRICTNSWDKGEGQVARADDFAGLAGPEVGPTRHFWAIYGWEMNILHCGTTTLWHRGVAREQEGQEEGQEETRLDGNGIQACEAGPRPAHGGAAGPAQAAEAGGHPRPARQPERQPGPAGAVAQRQLECRGELGAGDSRTAAGDAQAVAHREEEPKRAAGLDSRCPKGKGSRGFISITRIELRQEENAGPSASPPKRRLRSG